MEDFENRPAYVDCEGDSLLNESALLSSSEESSNDMDSKSNKGRLSIDREFWDESMGWMEEVDGNESKDKSERWGCGISLSGWSEEDGREFDDDDLREKRN